MRRDVKSKRSQRFFKRNDLSNEQVKDYIVSLLENVFNIKEYAFNEYKWYGISLFLKEYVCYIDKDFVELKVVRNDKVICSFEGDSCWYRALKFISIGE